MILGHEKVIGFMRLRTGATILSIFLCLASFVSLTVNGLIWGLDFTGGTLVEISYDSVVSVADVREQLGQLGYSDIVVQEFGSENNVLIRLPGLDPSLGYKVAKELGQNYSGVVTTKRVEYVGSQVGERMREQGLLGMLLALGLVMLYIAFRFQFKFSVGAVTALTHDTVIVLGAFSLFGIPFDLTVMAAVLAVIGYSLNDTIIVYDRIRENFRQRRKLVPEEVINISLTQTLGRTLATSGTTLMVLLSLFLFGGDMIHGFATALIIGIVIGTYSSIYIASNMLVYLGVSREDLLVTVKKDTVEDGRP